VAGVVTYSGALTGHRRPDGVLQIEAADTEISMSLGLALTLAAAGDLTMRHGHLVLAGVTPAGEHVEYVYAITGLAVAVDADAAEGGWLNLRQTDTSAPTSSEE
jgi:mannose-1-phosphate guanylyltransferase